jgi:hypothetical protein
MHYLIQKTTRQHIAVADDMPCPVECVKVRADRNGWVVYHGVVCPVPTNSRVDICTMDGKVFAGMLAWDVKWSRVSDYRPECDTIMARAGETADDLPAATATGPETAAMLLSIICAFAIGALIGWGWM